MIWTLTLLLTGIGGMWLAPKHWAGWLLYTGNEVVWFAYAIHRSDTPLLIMAVIWFALGVRATSISYRKAHSVD